MMLIKKNAPVARSVEKPQLSDSPSCAGASQAEPNRLQFVGASLASVRAVRRGLKR